MAALGALHGAVAASLSQPSVHYSRGSLMIHPIRSDDQLTALVKGKGSETFGKIVDRLKESPLFNVRGAGQLTVAMVTSQFKKIRDYAVEQRRSAEKFDACGDDFTEGLHSVHRYVEAMNSLEEAQQVAVQKQEDDRASTADVRVQALNTVRQRNSMRHESDQGYEPMEEREEDTHDYNANQPEDGDGMEDDDDSMSWSARSSSSGPGRAPAAHLGASGAAPEPPGSLRDDRCARRL